MILDTIAIIYISFWNTCLSVLPDAEPYNASFLSHFKASAIDLMAWLSIPFSSGTALAATSWTLVATLGFATFLATKFGAKLLLGTHIE